MNAITILALCTFIFSSVRAESSKEIALNAINEIFLKRNPDAVDKFIAENYIQHQPGLPHGRTPFKEYLIKLFRGFPDYHGSVESVIFQDDLVSFHFKWTGTHTGEFMGVKATGKKIYRRTADVLRIKDGLIVEHWGVVDQIDMLKELGLTKGAILD